MPDQTGSLLEASGLPFQLREDGLPDVAADPPRPGTGLPRCPAAHARMLARLRTGTLSEHATAAHVL